MTVADGTLLLEQENEIVRRAAAYLSQANLSGEMRFPLVRDLAAEGAPVAVTCRVLKISRGHYYRWIEQPGRS